MPKRLSEREATVWRDRIFESLVPNIPTNVRPWFECSIDPGGPSANITLTDPGNSDNSVVLQIWFQSDPEFISINVPNWLKSKVKFPDVRSEESEGFSDYVLDDVSEADVVELLAALAREYSK